VKEGILHDAAWFVLYDNKLSYWMDKPTLEVEVANHTVDTDGFLGEILLSNMIAFTTSSKTPRELYFEVSNGDGWRLEFASDDDYSDQKRWIEAFFNQSDDHSLSLTKNLSHHETLVQRIKDNNTRIKAKQKDNRAKATRMLQAEKKEPKRECSCPNYWWHDSMILVWAVEDEERTPRWVCHKREKGSCSEPKCGWKGWSEVEHSEHDFRKPDCPGEWRKNSKWHRYTESRRPTGRRLIERLGGDVTPQSEL